MVMLDGSHGKCSGTTVGPHAILTAEHCLDGAVALLVDGKPVSVKTVYLDHNDHALAVIDTTFTRWAMTADDPEQGDEVFIVGNPGDLDDQYRHGYASGYHVADNQKWTLYDINGFFGDSGSGIFDSRGFLVGVISIEVSQAYGDAYVKLMGSLPLAFTEEQWDLARA